VRLPGTMSEPEEYALRSRICDLGYLRTPWRGEDGKLAYRCPAEPVTDHVRKGGQSTDTAERKCLCNGLLAAIDLPQVQENGYVERAIVTSGDELRNLPACLEPGYTARDVMDYLLARPLSASAGRDRHL
jgi:hypothetical protein